jgi:hypothetical protein
MRHKDNEPTIRCGYCDRRIFVTETRKHWTWSRCNLRPAAQR